MPNVGPVSNSRKIYKDGRVRVKISHWIKKALRVVVDPAITSLRLIKSMTCLGSKADMKRAKPDKVGLIILSANGLSVSESSLD
jgi:hypothetical protein